MSATAVHPPAHDHDHAHDHHELPFWQKYIISTDHKVIGMQYGITALCFLAFGFILMLYMRWSIAYPDAPVTGLARTFINLLGGGGADRWLADGRIGGELYNMFGAMHGTIMVFLGVVPLGFAAFGNYVTPLQIGAVTWRSPA